MALLTTYLPASTSVCAQPEMNVWGATKHAAPPPPAPCSCTKCDPPSQGPAPLPALPSHPAHPPTPRQDVYLRRVTCVLGSRAAAGGRPRIAVHFAAAGQLEELRVLEGEFADRPLQEMPVHVTDILAVR